MKILVTGASGFIGAHVAAELEREGAGVVAFCRSEPARLSDWRQGDVRDRAVVERAVRGCDVVVHTAATYSYRRSEAMHAVNVEGTRNVIEAAILAGAKRVIMTSSSATCGPVRGRPATEQDAPPRWELRVPYKRTKLEAERVALAAADQLDVVCVNPTTAVGPGDRKPTPSGKMVRDLVQGRMHAYLRRGGINVVAVEDVARGHALALEHGRRGERYILGGEDLWLGEAFAIALQAVGQRPPRLAVPWSAVYGAAVLADRLGRAPDLLVPDEVRLARLPLFFSSEKARAELGYRPRPAAEALAAAAHWFAAGGHEHELEGLRKTV
jgi:dihydroflavonol-4-reductase